MARGDGRDTLPCCTRHDQYVKQWGEGVRFPCGSSASNRIERVKAEKAEKILHAAPFQALESDVDTTKATEQKLNDTLKTLLEKKAISKPLYNHLRVSPGCSKLC